MSWPRWAGLELLDRYAGWDRSEFTGDSASRVSVRSRLVGFVNVAWDGGAHFFLLDTTVHPDWRHRGIGRRLVLEAISDCRSGPGEWIHVDADDGLMTSFYAHCGFQPAPAGLVYVGPTRA